MLEPSAVFSFKSPWISPRSSSFHHRLEFSLGNGFDSSNYLTPRTMDLAKTLIRSVARSFYDLHHVLVVDALMVHSAYARLAGPSS